MSGSQAKVKKMRNWVDAWFQEARFAVRMLGRSRLFTVSALLTLALGIGANTAIFSLIDDLLLRPLPVRDPDRLVQVVLRGDETSTVFSFPMLAAIEQRTSTLRGLFTWNATQLSLGWGVDAKRINGAVASGEVYKTLGIKAEVGRLFGPGDDSSDAPSVAVISEHFWSTEFHRDPNVIGRKITLNRHAFTIIGVTPRNFMGIFAGSNPDVTIPFHADAALHPKWDMEHTNWIRWLSIFGRLQPGISMANAEAELRVISPDVWKAINSTAKADDQKQFVRQTFGLRPGGRGDGLLAARYKKPLLVLITVSALVLLIACVNLANLMMARAAQRRKEISVRLALGAGRARLIRQLLTESLLISFAGAGLGAGVAEWGILLVMKFLPLDFDLRPDPRVLCYLAGLAVFTGILFGIAPAMRGTDLSANEALKLGRIGLPGGRWNLGRVLVSIQVAFSVVLLLSALLFVRTLRNLRSQEVGFDRENLMFISTDCERSGMGGEELARFYNELLARVRALPFVRSASLAAVVPLSGAYVYEGLEREQWPNLDESQRTVYTNQVAPEYFKTVRIPLLEGRDFNEHDDSAGEEPAILNTAATRVYFAGRDPVGRLFAIDAKTVYRVIGVVADAKYSSLRAPAPRTMFLPAMRGQKMSPNPMMAGTNWNLIIRASTDAGSVISAVRGLVRASGKDVVIEEALPFDELVNGSLLSERILAILATFFSVLAAALAALGLYGVLGYTIARRTSEIGVRLALGAIPAEVLRMVLREALALAGAGVLIGIAAGVACGGFISSLLFEVRASDPVTMIVTAVFMMALAGVAGFLPARRASLLDPMAALRWE